MTSSSIAWPWGQDSHISYECSLCALKLQRLVNERVYVDIFYWMAILMITDNQSMMHKKNHLADCSIHMPHRHCVHLLLVTWCIYIDYKIKLFFRCLKKRRCCQWNIFQTRINSFPEVHSTKQKQRWLPCKVKQDNKPCLKKLCGSLKED